MLLCSQYDNVFKWTPNLRYFEECFHSCDNHQLKRALLYAELGVGYPKQWKADLWQYIPIHLKRKPDRLWLCCECGRTKPQPLSDCSYLHHTCHLTACVLSTADNPTALFPSNQMQIALCESHLIHWPYSPNAIAKAAQQLNAHLRRLFSCLLFACYPLLIDIETFEAKMFIRPIDVLCVLERCF